MAVTRTELGKLVMKLDDVKIELLRLRAALLPDERRSSSERKQIEKSLREMGRSRCVTLAQFRKTE